ATLQGSCKRNRKLRRSFPHSGHAGYSRFAEISAAGSFKVICSSKVFTLDGCGESAFCATAAAPMYHFARMQQSGGNETTPVFPLSGNGFGLARLIGNAY